ICVPRVPVAWMSQYEISLFRLNQPVHVHLFQMSQCFVGQIFPVRPIRPIRILQAQMSLLLPDCFFSFWPIRPVRVLHVLVS
ncbi:hypothetical protein KI387_009563, partial [Taxus chinensis]